MRGENSMQNNSLVNVNSYHGILLVCFAGVLFGTSGTAMSFVPESISAAFICLLRLGFAGLAFSIIAIWQSKSRKTLRLPSLNATYAALAMIGVQCGFYKGINLVGVAMGTILLVGSYPVFTGLLALVARKEKPTLKWMFSTLLAIVGLVFLMLDGFEGGVNFAGIAYTLCGGVSFAVFVVLTKGMVEKRGSISVLAETSMIAALILCPVIFIDDISWLVTPTGQLIALYLGLITYAIPMFLFMLGLKMIQVATAATLNLVEPLTAACLGVFFLNEQLTFSAAIGMSFILGGMLWLSLDFNRICKKFISSKEQNIGV